MSGPAKEGKRKNGQYKAVSTAPSINKTPVGSSTPPLPYPTIQDLSNSEAVVPTVTLNGDPAYVLGQTEQPSCQGDDPGTAKGVKSGTVNGYVKPTGASSTVTMGGRPAVRHSDPCVMNGGNNPGIYIAPAPAAANPAKSAAQTSKPPQALETPAEKSWFERSVDYLKEKLTPAAEQPVEATKGAAKGIANTPSYAGDIVVQGSMLKQAAELEQAAAFQSLAGMDEAARASAEAAQALRDGVSQVNLPKFEMSNPAQESGDFIATAIQLAAGGVGILKSVGKIPSLLKGAATAETVVADTAKIAGSGEKALATTGKAAGAEANAAKAAAGTEAATAEKAAKEVISPGDGVVVKQKLPDGMKGTSNKEIREWYNEQTSPERMQKLDKQWQEEGLSLEDRAKKAFDIRHDARLTAREYMENAEEVAQLQARDLAKYGSSDGPTFAHEVAKYEKMGHKEGGVFQAIIDGASRTNAEYNAKFGITR